MTDQPRNKRPRFSSHAESPSPVRELVLVCCVIGSNTPFPVDISSSRTVGHLKETIRQKNPHDLKEIEADKLSLFNVSIPDEDDLPQKLKNAVDGIEPLDPTTEIIEIFPDEPPEETIHIAVKLQNEAELPRAKHKRELYSSRASALRDSMDAVFVGQSATALFSYLVDCQNQYKKSKYYAKFTSVCNSSGTGKTKAILELSNSTVLVYINMRPTTDYENYPPRDDEIARLFEMNFRTAYQYHRSCLRIFRALFQQLLAELSQLLRQSPDDFTDMFHRWNERIAPAYQDRETFFEAVGQLYRQMATDSGDGLALALVTDYRRLCELFKSFPGVGPAVVIALDETDELTKWRGGSDDGYSPAHILGEVIRGYSTWGSSAEIWVVFSSTNTGVDHFVAPAAPVVTHALQRVFENGSLLFPPFSTLQWDIFATPPEELDVLSVGSYNDAIGFGRPLWKSVASIYEMPESMTRFAITKLTCQSFQSFQTGEAIPDVAMLAVLSQRFALGVLFGSYGTIPFISKSVASHMRYLHSTTDDCSWQYTEYLSEPVLSHAAATLMHKNKGSLSSHLRILIQEIRSGLIDAGEIGELLGRLLFLISRDYAAILAYDIKVSEPLPDDLLPPTHRSIPFPCLDTPFFPYLRPVPLLDVLNILFGPDWSSTPWDKHEEDPDAKERWIKFTFGRAYISCSHWVVMTKDVGPATTSAENWLKGHFLCGSAVQCHHNQPLIDAVVPIMLLDDKGQYLGMTSFLLQYRNKNSAASTAPSSIEVEHESINLDTKQPYVAICFHFGVQEEVSARANMPSCSTSSSPALRIAVKGLSETVFPMLKARPDITRNLLDLRNATRRKDLLESKEAAFVRATCQIGKTREEEGTWNTWK
ncbi:hypothetical protein VKT23_008684 [Stygiomarasmius scandens]|uniref:Crinkler effector protein N-terminal domain-containing protein n=1 Tax=Marasmiellus scandens TaxID=2682957 RepID=A0ABR1JI90_9AGAR